jgi:hypothetical protein
MPWAKVDDRLQFHPKLRKVGLAGTGLFVKSLSYCAAYATDGFVDEVWVRAQVEQPGEDAELPGALVKAGLWHQAKGGYRVHDYLSYNLSAAEWEARRARAERAAKARWGASGNASRNAEPEPDPEPAPDVQPGEG